MAITLDFESCEPILKYWYCNELYFILKVKTTTGYDYINLKMDKRKSIDSLVNKIRKAKGINNLKYCDYSSDFYSALIKILNKEEETVYYCGTTDKKVIKTNSYIFVDDGIEVDYDNDEIIVNIGSKYELDIIRIPFKNCNVKVHGTYRRLFATKLKEGMVLA